MIKLDANAERPEQRSGFKIKNLLRPGIEHRVDLLHAAPRAVPRLGRRGPSQGEGRARLLRELG